MKECCGKNFILNGEIKPAEEFDNNLVYVGETIYEVIRMVRGVPVFFNDHMERLSRSISIQNMEMITGISTLKNDTIRLNESEKRKEVNIKIVFNYKDDLQNYLIYYIESNYPTPVQYGKGVKGMLFWAERKDPQSKVLNNRMRAAIHQALVDENAYEALLVNNENLITEGSKSNLFFMSADTLYTAPDECILKGVTRKHILDISRTEQIPVEYRCINADDLDKYDAAFMTGTSPMVLPFCCVNGTFFSVSHPLLERLRELYIQKVEESLHEFSSEQGISNKN
jgi:branched-chain amino acid aminotransferase